MAVEGLFPGQEKQEHTVHYVKLNGVGVFFLLQYPNLQAAAQQRVAFIFQFRPTLFMRNATQVFRQTQH